MFKNAVKSNVLNESSSISDALYLWNPEEKGTWEEPELNGRNEI